MPKPLKREPQFVMSPTSQMAFAVALCALAAAGIGSIVNHWLTGWMAVGGMVGVGLFYAAVGILNLRANHPLYDDDANQNISQRTARADNLFGEPVTWPRSIPRTAESHQLRLRSEGLLKDASEASKTRSES